MTEDERIATFAMAFAKDLAPAILARLSDAAEALRLASRLAAATRQERLLAVGRIFSPDGVEVRARAAATAKAERPRVARLLLALAAGHHPEGDWAPALVRICRERIGL